MNILLASLLLLGPADDLVEAKRSKDGSVTICLPSLPPGSEYHNVLVVCGNSTYEPIEIEPDIWSITSEENSGLIKGIICGESTCTPFKANWQIMSEQTDDHLTAMLLIVIILALMLIISLKMEKV